LTHPDAAQIARAMRVLANVIPDFRKPQTIREAMSPLYNSYSEVYTGVERIRDLVNSAAYRSVDMTGGRVA
jgi:kynureninase